MSLVGRQPHFQAAACQYRHVSKDDAVRAGAFPVRCCRGSGLYAWTCAKSQPYDVYDGWTLERAVGNAAATAMTGSMVPGREVRQSGADACAPCLK